MCGHRALDDASHLLIIHEQKAFNKNPFLIKRGETRFFKVIKVPRVNHSQPCVQFLLSSLDCDSRLDSNLNRKTENAFYIFATQMCLLK